MVLNTRLGIMLLGALLVTSCKSGSDFKAGVAVESQTPAAAPTPAPAVDDSVSAGQTPGDFEGLGSLTDKYAVTLKVDLVFAIDTSGSMDDELLAVQNNLLKLITTLNDGKLDSRIHMLLNLPIAVPAGVASNKAALVRQRVDSNNAISRLNALFAGTYAASYFNIDGTLMPTPLAFRKEAQLEVVVISDDNGVGTGNLAADFDPSKTLKATFNAIVGLSTSVESDTCGVAEIGTEYLALAAASKGSVLDICAVDWSALIARLSEDIVKRSVTFTLSKKPADPKNIVVVLDKQKMAAADWKYDANSNAVTLIKTSTVKDGSALTLNYNPAN